MALPERMMPLVARLAATAAGIVGGVGVLVGSAAFAAALKVNIGWGGLSSEGVRSFCVLGAR